MKDVEFQVSDVIIKEISETAVLRVFASPDEALELEKYEHERSVILVCGNKDVILDVEEINMGHGEVPVFGFISVGHVSWPLEDLNLLKGKSVRITLEQEDE